MGLLFAGTFGGPLKGHSAVNLKSKGLRPYGRASWRRNIVCTLRGLLDVGRLQIRGGDELEKGITDAPGQKSAVPVRPRGPTPDPAPQGPSPEPPPPWAPAAQIPLLAITLVLGEAAPPSQLCQLLALLQKNQPGLGRGGDQTEMQAPSQWGGHVPMGQEGAGGGRRACSRGAGGGWGGQGKHEVGAGHSRACSGEAKGSRA